MKRINYIVDVYKYNDDYKRFDDDDSHYHYETTSHKEYLKFLMDEVKDKFNELNEEYEDTNKIFKNLTGALNHYFTKKDINTNDIFRNYAMAYCYQTYHKTKKLNKMLKNCEDVNYEKYDDILKKYMEIDCIEFLTCDLVCAGEFKNIKYKIEISKVDEDIKLSIDEIQKMINRSGLVGGEQKIKLMKFINDYNFNPFLYI